MKFSELFSLQKEYDAEIALAHKQIEHLILAKVLYEDSHNKFKNKFKKLKTLFTYLTKIYEYVGEIIVEDETNNLYSKAQTLSLQ